MTTKLQELAKAMVVPVQDYLRRNLAPIAEEVKALAKRLDFIPAGATWESLKGEPGAKGADAVVDQQAVVAEVLKQVPPPKDGQDGKDGADVDMEQVRAMLKAMVDEAVAALPKAQDGRDGKDADAETVRAEVQRALDALPKPKDGANGKDADPLATAAMVKEAVAQIPQAKDGRDGEDGRDALDIEILEGIDPGQRYPRKTFAKHRGGVWRSFRATDPLGAKSGELEKSGWSCVWDGVASVASVQDPADPRNLAIGLKTSSGEVVENLFTVPFVMDQGVFKDGQNYKQGDGVTWARHFWVAQRDTSAKPEAGSDWRLCVKGGRDGKDGRDGIDKTLPVKLKD